MPKFNTWHSPILDSLDTFGSALNKYWSLISALLILSKSWVKCAHTMHTHIHTQALRSGVSDLRPSAWAAWIRAFLLCFRMMRIHLQGAVGAKQCTGSNNKTLSPTPLLPTPANVLEKERACDSFTYCITTRGNDTNLDNFHCYGWGQFGLTISEILLLKYSQW